MELRIDASTHEGNRLGELIRMRIDQLRSTLESPLTAEETAEVRGRISELRSLIANPLPEFKSPSYSPRIINSRRAQ